jgi:hypothetical protein
MVREGGSSSGSGRDAGRLRRAWHGGVAIRMSCSMVLVTGAAVSGGFDDRGAVHPGGEGCWTGDVPESSLVVLFGSAGCLVARRRGI